MTTTTNVDVTPSPRGGRWARRPGARRVLAAAVLAGAVALTLILVLGSSHGQAYGGLPSWLPKSARQLVKNPAPPVEIASATHPILSEQQGYPVQVRLPGASATMTITGPEFPSWVTTYARDNLWSETKLVPSTFIVSLTKVTGTIPLSARAFTALTGTGTIEPSRLRSADGTALPSAVHDGQSVTFQVRTNTVEGQGSIRWSPTSTKVLAAWLYQLEVD